MVRQHGGVGHKVVRRLGQRLQVGDFLVQLLNGALGGGVLLGGENVGNHAALGHPGAVRHPVAEHAVGAFVNDLLVADDKALGLEHVGNLAVHGRLRLDAAVGGQIALVAHIHQHQHSQQHRADGPYLFTVHRRCLLSRRPIFPAGTPPPPKGPGGWGRRRWEGTPLAPPA